MRTRRKSLRRSLRTTLLRRAAKRKRRRRRKKTRRSSRTRRNSSKNVSDHTLSYGGTTNYLPDPVSLQNATISSSLACPPPPLRQARPAPAQEADAQYSPDWNWGRIG